MLVRLRAAAAAGEVADRVETHLVNLDGDWPAVIPASIDLAWAALSLHHVTRPVQVLRQVFEVLRPGGVLIVIEPSGATTYEPADLGTGSRDLGERLAGGLPAPGYQLAAEWMTALEAAGFSLIKRLEISFNASANTIDGARYLELQMTHNRAILVDDLCADDLAAIDAAISELAAGTFELGFTSSRDVWTAVRPASVEPILPDKRSVDQLVTTSTNSNEKETTQ